jgi:hypothetical protein
MEFDEAFDDTDDAAPVQPAKDAAPLDEDDFVEENEEMDKKVLITDLESDSKSKSHKRHRRMPNDSGSVKERPKSQLTRPAMLPQRDVSASQNSTRTRQGHSILRFNPNLPPRFTEQKTLQAMHLLGIIDSDLMYPSESTLNTYSKDPELREIARRECQRTVDDLISRIRRKRKELIRAESEETEDTSTPMEVPSSAGFLEQEQKRIDKIIIRQKRDVESLLLGILTRSEEEKEELERQKREQELERQRELAIQEKHRIEMESRIAREADLRRQEEERRKKAEEDRRRELERERLRQERLEKEMERRKQEALEEDRKRLEKAEAARRHLEEIEEKKREDSAMKQAELERREARRLKHLAEETERLREIREQRQAYLQEQLEKAKTQQLELLERKREAAALRDQKADEQLKKFAKERETKQKEFAEREAAKVERSQECKKSIEEQFREKARQLQLRELAATVKFRQIEEAKLKKLKEAREAYENNSSSMQVKFMKIKEAEAERNSQIQEAFQKREAEMIRMSQRREKERAKTAVVQRIERERKTAAAARAERQRSAEKEVVNEKFARKLKRIADAQALREHMRIETDRAKLQLEQKKLSLNSRLSAIRSKGMDENLMRQLASEFDLDLGELKERVRERRAKRAKYQSGAVSELGVERSALPPLKEGRSKRPSSSVAVVKDMGDDDDGFENDFDDDPIPERPVGRHNARRGREVVDDEFEDDFG